MTRKSLLPVLTATLLCSAVPTQAQDFPDGPGKETFIQVCGACHDINRARAGYTPDGWRTVMQMMIHFDGAGPKDQIETLTQYLIKTFPERPRPVAKIIDGPVAASIKLWDVPTPGSRPHDPLATKDGAIWYTGQMTNKLGRVDPKTGAVKEYRAQDAAHRPARSRRGSRRQHLVHRQPREPGRQTQSEDRRGDGVPDAGSESEGSAQPRDRARWNRLVHRAAIERRGTGRPQDRRGQGGAGTDAARAALRHPDQFQGRSDALPIRHQQARDHRSQDHGDQGIHLAARGLRARAGSRSRPTTPSGTPTSRAAISAASIRRPARTRSGRRRAARAPSLTASSSRKARSGTTNPSPSRTRSCASTRRRRRSRAGRSPGRAAATSCARWTSRRRAIRSPPTAWSTRSGWWK